MVSTTFEMEMKQSQLAIFRSSDSDATGKAVALLKEAGVQYELVDRQEGGVKAPWRVHSILVSSSDADAAHQVLSAVPSEVILSEHNHVSTASNKTLAWLIAIPLITVIVYTIINMLIN
jgi:hypothetical protein